MIGDGQAVVERLHRELFPPRPERPQPAAPAAPVNVDDAELALKACRSNEKFRRLWEGDTSMHPSHSEADLALCSHLAWWTRHDGDRIDRLFRQSGLYREKWEREDYRSRTIGEALARQVGSYDPGRQPEPPAATDPSTEARIAALEARVAELERKLAEERAARSELVYSLRNKAVKTERSTAIAAACILEHKKSLDPGHELPGKGTGWHRVYLDAIAEQSGCSAQRASAHLDRLNEWGVIEKTLEWGHRDAIDPDTGEVVRQGVKEMYLRSERPLSQTLAALATLEPEKPQTWGGSRPKTCPDHPDAGTVKRWSLHCQECDRLIDSDEDYQRPPNLQDEASSNRGAVVIDPSFQDESRGVARAASRDISRRATGARGQPREASRSPAGPKRPEASEVSR